MPNVKESCRTIALLVKSISAAFLLTKGWTPATSAPRRGYHRTHAHNLITRGMSCNHGQPLRPCSLCVHIAFSLFLVDFASRDRRSLFLARLTTS